MSGAPPPPFTPPSALVATLESLNKLLAAAFALALANTPAPAQVQTDISLAPTAYSAKLSAPRTVSDELPLSLTVTSVGTHTAELAAPRDSRQDCASAPLVRVLEVGTRRVVYPPAQAEPLLCAQDMDIRTVGAGEAVTFTRELQLPAGEYMVEGWFVGIVGGEDAEPQRTKIAAQPVRVSVR